MSAVQVGRLETIAVGRLEGRVPIAIAHTKSAKEKRNEEIICKIIANEAATQEPRKMMTDDHVDMILFYEKDQTCIYFAITSSAYPPRLAHKLLEDLKSTFASNFSEQIATATKFSLSRKSSGALATICERYIDGNKDKITKVRGEVEAVKATMQDNIDTVLRNQEKIEDIDRRAAELNEHTDRFRKTSRSLRNTMCIRKWKIIIILVIVIVAVLGYIGIAVIPPLIK